MRGSISVDGHSPFGTKSLKHLFGSVLHLFFLSVVCLGSLGLFSCDSDEDGMGKKAGTLQVHLAADTTSLEKGAVNPLTKVGDGEFDKFLWTDDYQVRIIKDDKDTVKNYERYDQMPPEVSLKEGAYTLIACKGDNLPAAFLNPYFEGSVDFQIKQHMSTPLEVTCSLANARVTTEFAGDFKDIYADYTVLLSTPYTAEDFKIAKDETRAAYMQVAEKGTEMAIGISLRKAEEETDKVYYVPTPLKLSRRQNIRLIFKAEGGDASVQGIGLTVVLDDEMQEMTFTTEIPDFMWKPFDKPTLTPTDFKAGDTFEFQAGLFAEDPYVGVNMPGGIGSLCIKYWREGEDEEEAAVYDLATEEGRQAALDKYYTWTVGNESDTRIAGRKTAVLYLRQALNSLPSSDEATYTYHYQIYGTDATGKANASDVLTFDVDVLPADAPHISATPAETAYEIVEGDELPADWKVTFSATGLIDPAETKVVVNDGSFDQTYPFMQDGGNSLQLNFGAQTEIADAANATISFPKTLAARLAAPATGSKVYTFTFYLKDKNGKEYSLSKTVTVYAPVFTLETTADDAFARRIVLRMNTSGRENPQHIGFEYRPEGEPNWMPVPSSGLTAPDPTADPVHYVDTLKGLNPESVYSVRAVYNAHAPYVRRSAEQTFTTEKIQGFLTGALTDPLDDWSIERDDNGSDLPGYNEEILVGFIGVKLKDPWRCWEVWLAGSADHPSDWNTLNKKTTADGKCHTGSVTAFGDKSWTRYVANSGTLKTEGVSGSAALIRTVGWGSGNTAEGTSGSTINHSDPGELYLGSYEGNPVYGIAFGSRPSGFSFHYKYENPMKGDDRFTAEIVVVDEKGQTVSQQFISSEVTAAWKEATVHMDYPEGAGKAKKMYIRFVSGQAGNYGYNDFPVKAKGTNLSNGEYTGSHLSIDNVTIIYE